MFAGDIILYQASFRERLMLKLDIVHVLGAFEVTVILEYHIIFENIALLSSIPALRLAFRVLLASDVAAVQVPHDHLVAVAGVLD